MGLRRRLSKKWNETVNGVLSGPGVDVDSVNTNGLGNNGSDVPLEDAIDTRGNLIKNTNVKDTPAVDIFEHELADGAKTQFDPNNKTSIGLFNIYSNTDGWGAIVNLQGGLNNTEILAQSGSDVTTTQDNDGTTNIYWSSANSQYEINNEAGGQKIIVVISLARVI